MKQESGVDPVLSPLGLELENFSWVLHVLSGSFCHSLFLAATSQQVILEQFYNKHFDRHFLTHITQEVRQRVTCKKFSFLLRTFELKLGQASDFIFCRSDGECVHLQGRQHSDEAALLGFKRAEQTPSL